MGAGAGRVGGNVISSIKALVVVGGRVVGASVVLVRPLPRPLTLSLGRDPLAEDRLPPDWLGNDLNFCLIDDLPSESSCGRSLLLASIADSCLSSSCISLTAACCCTDKGLSWRKFPSVVSLTFSLAVLNKASRALSFFPCGVFLKLTLTICSLRERNPLGSEMVPTAEVPWKGFFSSSSS